MACKINISNALSELNNWSPTSDNRDAITKEFKFKDF